MSRKPTDRSRTAAATASDDVETLLRAAEDELLLNLSINSHAARGSSHAPSSYLDPDLHSRFQSLKSAKPPPRQHPKETRASGSAGACSEDDLFARLAALKGSIAAPLPPLPPCLGAEEDDDGDEVDKVMRWAIDAARLDPSPESDMDDDLNTNLSSSSDNDDEDEDEEDNRRTKDLKKKNKK